MTFTAVYDTPEWGLLAMDTAMRRRADIPGTPINERPIVSYTEISKLNWHPAGWYAGGAWDVWIQAFRPVIDSLSSLDASILSAAIQPIAERAIDLVPLERAEKIRRVQCWMIVSLERAVVLNWRGEDANAGRPMRWALASAWPSEIPNDVGTQLQRECNAALQGATLSQAVQLVARFMGALAEKTETGISQAIEMGIIDRRTELRHLHIPITNWRRVAADEIEPIGVTDRASTQRTLRTPEDT